MSRKPLGIRKITIVLHRPEDNIISQAESDGYNISEIVREIIRKWGAEVYPPTPAYAEALKVKAELAKKKAIENDQFSTMPPEAYAEGILRGQVREGNRVYFRVGGGREVNFPLLTIKERNRDNTPEIDIHMKLLDRSFRYGDRELSEVEWSDIWDGWSERRPNWQTLQMMGLWPVEKYWASVGKSLAGVPAETAADTETDPEDLVDIST